MPNITQREMGFFDVVVKTRMFVLVQAERGSAVCIGSWGVFIDVVSSERLPYLQYDTVTGNNVVINCVTPHLLDNQKRAVRLVLS